MTFVVLSIATFVVTGALFAIVERARPVRRPRPLGRALAQDLPFVLLSNALPGWAVGALAAALHVDGPLAGAHVVVQWLAVLGVTELSFYVVHRALHTVPALWPLHAPHHAAVEMDWIAGFRKHTGEALLHGLVPLPVLVALAPAPEVMLFHTLFGVVFTGFTHWNASLRLGWADALVVTPRVHAWHHAANPIEQRHNLAGKISVLDRVFGTWNGARGWPGALGLDERNRDRDGWIATHVRRAR